MRSITIGPRPTDRSELSEWYEEVLLEQERCGLSIAEVADEIGVSAPTLYSWRRRLLAWSDEAEAVGGAEVDADESLRLVRVRVRDEDDRDALSDVAPKPASPTPLVVRLAGGHSIEVPTGFDADELSRLIRVVSGC